MARSLHTVTNYFNDEKVHAVINSKLFQKLNYVNNTTIEVEVVKAEIEHKGPISVRFFILQYGKLRMLVFYNNFFTVVCDLNKFEELEMDTESVYLALAEKELEDCIRTEMKAKWERVRTKDHTNSFTADAVANLFSRKCCEKHKKYDKRESGLFNEEFRCTEMLYLCSKTYCCFDVTTKKSVLKGLNKRVFEQG